jgi:hypothetical protein
MGVSAGKTAINAAVKRLIAKSPVNEIKELRCDIEVNELI